ncbi:hypothetical protein DPEC_G00272580 [Dallia pectoralis]|uniref:Uncharacterized protein n=1 Tax=Dallia pectoralis TaxID=75939 RepID=A0ACC2FQ84_DALPE|nr:hypothetical protein DPEC_G00272580 [Dallia pectoralis]
MHHRSRTCLTSQLCKALKDGEPRTVQLVLSQGANPNLVGGEGVAAVHLAVGKETEKSIRCLKLILQHGADPNVRSSEGLTPVHVAAIWGCYQNLKMLLKNGGNPNLKDLEGNKPGDLAKQQGNRRCANLLQEYQSQSLEEVEDEDLPQFQYAIYSGQRDTSSSSESEECSVTSPTMSLLSDFGDDLLSSTRQTSLFDLSAVSNRTSVAAGSLTAACGHVTNHGAQGVDEWDVDSDWLPEAPSVLSSTRMSVAGPRSTLPILQEGVPLTVCGRLHPPQDIGLDLPSAGNRVHSPQWDAAPSRVFRRASRKSVSFREEVDEYFPVFGKGSPEQMPGGHGSPHTKDHGFDFSEYSDFLNSEHLATVLHHQGIDVTSPDHVFVFSRGDSMCADIDMDKTVFGQLPLEAENENKDFQNNVGLEVKVLESQPCSSGSSSDASKYSSCDSDQYVTILNASLQPGHLSSSGDSKLKETQINNRIESQSSTDSNKDSDEVKDKNIVTEISEGSKCSKTANTDDELQTLVDKLKLSVTTSQTPVASEICCTSSCVSVEDSRGIQSDYAPRSGRTPALEEDCDQLLTPSPFVTGRTRSRLSRSSFRTSKTSESLLSGSSLFEQTLPTPTRAHRHNVKSQGSEDVFDEMPCDKAPVHAGNRTEGTYGDSFVSYESQRTQGGSDGDDTDQMSCVGASQADTLIISKEVAVSASQAETFLISDMIRGHGSCVTASQADTLIITPSLAEKFPFTERENHKTQTQHFGNLRTCLKQNTIEGNEFLTDDLSSSSGALTKEDRSFGPREVDSWSTGDIDSQPASSSSLSSSRTTSSSSSSSYFSPKTDRPPSTPGTGCTPRYSISRLSDFHKPQRLANLSYTPGGRPVIPEVETAVDYLYTDTEQGHELIETHVPPTSNTSLSSSLSTSSSEDTVLYDWRSLQVAGVPAAKGKENQLPAKPEEWSESKGLTDKELRRRLVDLGESPGPISNRTRPVYMQRLRRLLLEPTGQQQTQQQSDQPHGLVHGHSPELSVALQTFVLPDCLANELSLCQQFDQPDQNRKWREGVIKSSFNYLLLDPRVTRNLPYRSHAMTPLECFQTFISAIFYVGKGKRSRPYSHLYEALEYHRGDKTSKKLCSKVKHILQVWTAGQGVISLHCFQNVIPVEAYTREACMVDAIGLKMLTNQKRGDYYGVVSTWPVKKKRELGVHLLHRAMQIFLAEGERQLRPPDIRVGQ